MYSITDSLYLTRSSFQNHTRLAFSFLAPAISILLVFVNAAHLAYVALIGFICVREPRSSVWFLTQKRKKNSDSYQNKAA